MSLFSETRRWLLIRPALVVLLWVSVWCVGFLNIAAAAEPAPQAAPATDLNRLFARTDGWTGADGVYSVALNKNRLLWLFGDTWIGKIRQGKRVDALLINNSVGLMERTRTHRRAPDYFWKTDAKGAPQAFFAPPDHRGWFWPLHGINTPRGLFVFLLQIEKTEDASVFGFAPSGNWLARISNPEAAPDQWRISYRKLPWSHFSRTLGRYWGTTIIADRGTLYIYGIHEDPQGKGVPKKLILARCPENDLDRFSAWEFYGARGWQSNPGHAEPLLENVATEGSIWWNPRANAYEFFYSESGFSPRILRSRAPVPQGPWSVPETVYTVTDRRLTPKTFAYAGKVHPELARNAQEIIVSYVINSLDFWSLTRDAGLYWPQFGRLSATD